MLNGEEVDLMAAVRKRAAEDEDPEVLSTENHLEAIGHLLAELTAAGNVRSIVATSGAGKMAGTVR